MLGPACNPLCPSSTPQMETRCSIPKRRRNWRSRAGLTPKSRCARRFKGRVVDAYGVPVAVPGVAEHALPQTERISRAFIGAEVAVVGLHSVFENQDKPTPGGARGLDQRIPADGSHRHRYGERHEHAPDLGGLRDAGHANAPAVRPPRPSAAPLLRPAGRHPAGGGDHGVGDEARSTARNVAGDRARAGDGSGRSPGARSRRRLRLRA